MSIGQIMAECDCQHTACKVRGYCMAARIAELEAELNDASEAWRAMRHVAVQNTDDPDQWELLISRMDAALNKDRAP